MKQYIDPTKLACVAIFATDEEGKQMDIGAGTTIYIMSIKDRKG